VRQEESGLRGSLGPLELRRKIVPFEPCATSDGLGWASLEVARYREEPASEIDQPAMTHHGLILYTRPPQELELWYEGVKRAVRPITGSISVVPAGNPIRWRWSGDKDTLHIYLEPGLIARVAAEAFGLDPARMMVPPLDGLDHPQLRARHISAPRQLARKPDGMLPQTRLRAVVEYVEEHLNAGSTLKQLAAVAHLSAYHFARQFKAATGLPPHQYVIMRRVERAKQLLQGGGDLSLAEVAAHVGFSDQSQFSHHFKRLVGVTPGQFRMSARIT
jgi:AraC family transcriptional regulator